MPDKIFHLKPWSPKIAQVAQTVIDDITSVAPELKVLFMGAAALKLPGKNDIDLDVLCNKKDISEYTHKLISVLGEPKDANDEIAVWNFIKDGLEIDCILSDPTISHVTKQKQRFELLKNNPNLLEEYKQLKIKSDGISYDEYEKLKIEFFEKISSSN